MSKVSSSRSGRQPKSLRKLLIEMGWDIIVALLRLVIFVVFALAVVGLTALVANFYFRTPSGALDVVGLKHFMRPTIAVELGLTTCAFLVALAVEVTRDFERIRRRRAIRDAHFFSSMNRPLPSGHRKVNTANWRRSVKLQSEMTSATPSFAQGMGSVLDLGDTLTEYNEAPSGTEADFLAHSHDAMMVQGDYLRAIHKIEPRITREKPKPDEKELVNG